MTTESQDSNKLFWILFVFLIPFQLHYNYVLNAFYHFGAPYFDAGLFANLLWHNSWEMINPSMRGDFSYLGIHFSPFLVIVAQLSHYIPAYTVEFFAGFMGIVYAASGVALFIVFMRHFPGAGFLKTALIAVISVGLAFNGNIMVGMWMPHFEYLIPTGIFLTLYCLHLNNLIPAWCFLIFTLSLREDAGLHLILFLGLLLVMKIYETRSLHSIRKYLPFFLASLGYSVFAFWAVSYVRDLYEVQEASVFRLIYSGTGTPYAHLTVSLIGSRLLQIAGVHLYLVTSLLVSIAYAIYRRDIYLVLGMLGIVPWFLLNVTAANGNTGYFYAYYGFPFVVALVWPMLACVWRYDGDIPSTAIKHVLILQLALFGAGLLAWDSYSNSLKFAPSFGARWGSYKLQPSVEYRDNIREFVRLLDSDPGYLGDIAAFHSFASLSRSPWGTEGHYFNETTSPVNTALYVAPDNAPVEMIRLRLGNSLRNHYCVTGTSVCLFTDRQLSDLGPFYTVLSVAP